MDAAKRRHYLRAQIRTEVVVHEAEGDLYFDSIDLSQGGAFVHSDILLDEGTEVIVSFDLPRPHRHVITRAKVVRGVKTPANDTGAGMGLSFVDLSPEDRTAIAEYVVQSLNAAF